MLDTFFCNLKSVICFPRTPSRFRVRVQVVDHFPRAIPEMTRPYCNVCDNFLKSVDVCGECKQSDTIRSDSQFLAHRKSIDSWQYLLKLVLKDRTGCVVAFLHAKHASTFFKMPAGDFSREPDAAEALAGKLALLLQVLPHCSVGFSYELRSTRGWTAGLWPTRPHNAKSRTTSLSLTSKTNLRRVS